jgi:hypothetical protein
LREDISSEPINFSGIYRGSRLFSTGGYLPLRSLFTFNPKDGATRFKTWEELIVDGFKPKQLFPFLHKGSYLFPSFLMTEEQWNLLCAEGDEVPQDMMHWIVRHYYEKDPRPYRALVSLIFMNGMISNLEICRYLTVQCGAFIDRHNVRSVCDGYSWATMVKAPLLRIHPVCSFCNGYEWKISNIAEKFQDMFPDMMVTKNDLSADHNGDRICPNRPQMFKHPTLDTLVFWSTADRHELTYANKCHLLERVSSKLHDHHKSYLTYFHMTEGDDGFHDVHGWHAHVVASMTDEMTMSVWLRGRVKEFKIRWCDYVILAGTMKLMIKINVATSEVITLTKVTELPFPVHRTFNQLPTSKASGRLARACIMLQVFMLTTGKVPSTLLIGEKKNMIGRLWTRLYTFLSSLNTTEGPIVDIIRSERITLAEGWRDQVDLTRCDFEEFE